MLRTGPAGCSPDELSRLILEQHGPAVARHLVADSLGMTDSLGMAPSLHRLAQLSRSAPREPQQARAIMTIAVCTRNRAAHLPECLAALQSLDYPRDLLEVMIVDNAPLDGSTREAVDRFPHLRYLQEPRPGLNWARNRAAMEARGEIIAYTDDDVSVDPGWLRAIEAAFRDERHAVCVTGLVVPDAIDTEAQALFERNGGFGRGFERNVFRVDVEGGQSAAAMYGGTGRFGTGANMAFRRAWLLDAGLFDTALDVGTPTNGGGDLDLFFRVLKEGHALVYEPAAIVRHRHRRNYTGLRTQVANNGIGFYSYLVRTAQAYPDERAALVRLGLWWLWSWNVRRLLLSFVRPSQVPRDLIVAELKGSFIGLRRYQAARRAAAAAGRSFDPPAAQPGAAA